MREVVNMSRSLIRRIDKLERLWSAPERARSPLVLCVQSEHEGALAPGERRVQDWFRDCGSMVWARERVTTEKADEGRRCPRGGYLLDVLEAFHEGVRGVSGLACVTCARGRR